MTARLVALDLDGTLLTDDSELPAGHERAVRELLASGIAVALVTGRPLLTTRWVHDRLGLRTPLVCFNGAWVGHPHAEPLAASDLAEADVRELVAELAAEEGAICCYPRADRWVMDREIALTARWRERYGAPIEIDPGRIADWRGPSCKLMYVGDPRDLALIAARVRARFPGRFHVVVSQCDRFEVSRAGITKAWGLERLAAAIGVARADVWAVGDADNDREMVAWAGHGCAMGHAPASLRDLARHLLPGIAARGLCALPALIAAETVGR
jgi:Cof subfamily protein (haloacid dehalogenase superfamily)